MTNEPVDKPLSESALPDSVVGVLQHYGVETVGQAIEVIDGWLQTGLRWPGPEDHDLSEIRNLLVATYPEYQPPEGRPEIPPLGIAGKPDEQSKRKSEGRWTLDDIAPREAQDAVTDEDSQSENLARDGSEPDDDDDKGGQ